jgi:hypothetical protein
MNHEGNADISPNVAFPVLNFANFQITALSLRIFLPIPYPSISLQQHWDFILLTTNLSQYQQ